MGIDRVKMIRLWLLLLLAEAGVDRLLAAGARDAVARRGGPRGRRNGAQGPAARAGEEGRDDTRGFCQQLP